MEVNQVTKIIVDCAMEVHRTLGPGLFASTYENCLNYELKQAGLNVQRQLSIPVNYKDLHMDTGYKIDFVVEDKVVIELRKLSGFVDEYKAHVLTYMKFTQKTCGLLIDFNVPVLVTGIQRFDM